MEYQGSQGKENLGSNMRVGGGCQGWHRPRAVKVSSGRVNIHARCRQTPKVKPRQTGAWNRIQHSPWITGLTRQHSSTYALLDSGGNNYRQRIPHVIRRNGRLTTINQKWTHGLTTSILIQSADKYSDINPGQCAASIARPQPP